MPSCHSSLNMSVYECQDTFIFEGSKPEYVQGRFINSHINTGDKTLVVQEFEPLHDSRFQTIKLVTMKEMHYLKLPDEFNIETVVGNVICIGCVGDLVIFQYVSSERRECYVKFLVGDLTSLKMSLFEDTHHFFNRDTAAIAPLECLLSPDKTVCLLRLPQPILSPKKWSKLLKCKKTDESKVIGPLNNITGTLPSKFRDRRFQLIAFDPLQPCKLVILLLDSYCSKCKISVRDLNTDKEVLQCTRKLPMPCLQQDKLDSDSEDDELQYYFLQDCSIVYDRSGETFLITCILTDPMDNTFCQIYFFSSHTFSILSSQTFSKMISIKKCEMVVPVFTKCNSQVMFCLVEKKSDMFVELFRYNVPKQLNLKSLCRSVIIRSLSLASSCFDLPLPPSLISYLQFNYQKFE